MRLVDFFSAWTGEGFFDGVFDSERHVDDAPECDFADDVAQSFAEAAQPFTRLARAVEARECLVCGEAVFSSTGSCCSAACSRELARTTRTTPGDRFGLLVAVAFVESSLSGQRWLFRCDCGIEIVRSASSMRLRARAGVCVSCPDCNPLVSFRGTKLTAAESIAAADRNRAHWARRYRKAA